MSQSFSGRLVFIGAGNMAEALVNGVLKSGVVSADRITVTDVLQERLDSAGCAAVVVAFLQLLEQRDHPAMS